SNWSNGERPASSEVREEVRKVALGRQEKSGGLWRDLSLASIWALPTALWPTSTCGARPRRPNRRFIPSSSRNSSLPPRWRNGRYCRLFSTFRDLTICPREPLPFRGILFGPTQSVSLPVITGPGSLGGL